MSHPLLWVRWVAAGLVAIALVSGCDTSIQPIDKEAGLFSIYGYLNLTREPHYVRIRYLKDPILNDSAAGVNATVRLDHMETGASEVLDDSVVVFQGVQTHNFRSDLNLQPQEQYRIVVERADGQSTQATATMPPFTEVVPVPEGTVNCVENMRATFPNVPEPRLVRANAGIHWRARWNWVAVDIFASNPGGSPSITFSPETIIRRIIPERILEATGPPRRYCDLLGKKKIRLAYIHFGPDWPPDSLLTNPVASRVENGLGVFGGLHRDTLEKEIEIPE